MALPLHPLLGLLVALALAGGVVWGRRAPARYRTGRLVGFSVLAAPVGFLGGALLVDMLLERLSPLPVDAGFVLVLLVGTVFAGLVFVAVRLVPWRGAGWGFLAVPLAFAAVLLVADLVRGAEGSGLTGAVILAAIPLAAAGPFAAATAPRGARDAAAGTTTATALVLALVLAVPSAVTGLTAPAAEMGTHAWDVRVTPQDPDVPYAVRIPFAFEDEDAATASVAVLRERARVTDGEGTIGWVDDDRYLEVQATGPVTVHATLTFLGTPRDVSGFPEALNATEVLLLAEGPLEATVDWTLTMVPDDRQTCRLDADYSVTVENGGVALLAPAENRTLAPACA